MSKASLRGCAVAALCLGALAIPPPAMADTITVNDGCSVTYDSGHVSVNISSGSASFESPSASADLGNCFVVTICCIPPLPSTTWEIEPPPIGWN